MQYDFEWDTAKGRRNRHKHRVSFEHSATVFRDPKALTLYDEKHSITEDRWITLGISSTGVLLVVHHTFQEIDINNARIRIFSSRKATAEEARQYME